MKGSYTVFLDNFLARCEARGESPSHALEAAGLSKSCLSKWKKYPDRTPTGDTVLQIANYFGCTFEDLLYSGPVKARTKTAMKIQAIVDSLSPDQQEYLLRLIQFVWGDNE